MTELFHLEMNNTRYYVGPMLVLCNKNETDVRFNSSNNLRSRILALYYHERMSAVGLNNVSIDD